jgi:hypothetical protein
MAAKDTVRNAGAGNLLIQFINHILNKEFEPQKHYLTHTLLGKGADKEMLWQAHRLRGHL